MLCLCNKILIFKISWVPSSVTSGKFLFIHIIQWPNLPDVTLYV